MDDATREAVQAYRRLVETSEAVFAAVTTGDVTSEGEPMTRERAAELIEPLAWEARQKITDAGLYDLPAHDFEAVVRQLYPNFRMYRGF